MKSHVCAGVCEGKRSGQLVSLDYRTGRSCGEDSTKTGLCRGSASQWLLPTRMVDFITIARAMSYTWCPPERVWPRQQRVTKLTTRDDDLLIYLPSDAKVKSKPKKGDGPSNFLMADAGSHFARENLARANLVLTYLHIPKTCGGS